MDYTEINKDGSLNNMDEEPCFGSVHWNRIKGIVYKSNVSRKLTRKQVNWWIGRINSIMPMRGALRWSWRTEGEVIKFFIPKVDRNKHKTLLYLTAFRYIDKEFFPTVVSFMHKHRRKLNTSARFLRALQLVHLAEYEYEGDEDENEMCEWYNSSVHNTIQWMSGHELILPASEYGRSADKPISLRRFRSNLRRGRSSVYAYFS